MRAEDLFGRHNSSTIDMNELSYFISILYLSPYDGWQIPSVILPRQISCDLPLQRWWLIFSSIYFSEPIMSTLEDERSNLSYLL